jgi:hypothetical protein
MVVVVGLLHRALCVSEFAIDRVAESPDYPSLHLVFEVGGIDDRADIDRDPDRALAWVRAHAGEEPSGSRSPRGGATTGNRGRARIVSRAALISRILEASLR